jgi:hypothetical protein
VARAIDQYDAMRLRQFLAEREPHIFHISACAVDQNDGGLGASAAARKTELGDVQPHVPYLHELTGWRMRSLDPRNAERGHRNKQAERKGECDDGGRGKHLRFASLIARSKPLLAVGS